MRYHDSVTKVRDELPGLNVTLGDCGVGEKYVRYRSELRITLRIDAIRWHSRNALEDVIAKGISSLIIYRDIR